jgi:3-deoxy-manno-octulosonate cytidylyltransferase (CMP-KDO synthetase)
MPKTVVIIPARMGSTRFPGKVLATLGGKPIIQHVYERSTDASLVSEVIIATDSEEVMRAVSDFGGRAVMTSPSHPSGTDRIAEVAATLDYDIIVNVQGDEPLIKPEIIDASIELLDDTRATIGTVASKIVDDASVIDPNVVKVAMDAEGFALYFSRAPIPYSRDEWASLNGAVAGSVYGHIGLYSYRRDALLKLASLPPTVLEQTEKLEQLRALEHGMRIKVAISDYETLGVDTPEDLERIKEMFEK